MDQVQGGKYNGDWAFADESYELIFRFDVEVEMQMPLDPKLTTSWVNSLTRANNTGRLNLTRLHWRYLRDYARGRSTVVGLPFESEGFGFDRIFNSDPYSMENCMVIERGLNFAKGTLKDCISSV